ncbi:MAG: HupE/UreJ family protein, partial [Rickettsiales bacterium]|nr:HupE/UreJ family protein [Rickettsiales bacterium]
MPLYIFSLFMFNLMLSANALAHTGAMGAAGGFAAGISHPVLGLDHLLAMVSVGVLSAQIGGRAIW